jgi:flagellum-specific peptidoglycan hydrolase FlgJ
MTPTEFIALLQGAAQTSAVDTKIPASFVIADAALESRWGASELAIQAMNVWGVKADSSWAGDTLTMNTREFENGAWVVVTAVWRKYASWLDALRDHAHFLQSNPRYAACFEQTTGVGWATAVAAAGYATDPTYATKIAAIITGNGLDYLDRPNINVSTGNPVVPAPLAPAPPTPVDIAAINATIRPAPVLSPGQPPMTAEQLADLQLIAKT